MAVYKGVTQAGVARALLEAGGKIAKNTTGATLVAGSVCSWANTGVLQLAEADAMSADNFAGVVYQDIPDGAFGLVIKTGKVPGILTSLGPVAGQPVFLSTTPGQMTLTAPGDPNAVARIGYAEPPDNATGLAVDLYVEFELIAAF
jgi:hypothetical protein